MRSINQQQSVHKNWMFRILSDIADCDELSSNIAFKGGTCASLLGYLDRFSVDLDFDYLPVNLVNSNKTKSKYRKIFHKIFEEIGLIIDQESKTQLQFFLKYKTHIGDRNTLKVEIIDNKVKSNIYDTLYFKEIDRFMQCQTIESMFSNKLVALTDRFEKHGSIATRDVYDINYFFNQGFSFVSEIIEERTGLKVKEYLIKLQDFIKANISQKLIIEDLNYLLDSDQLKSARKYLLLEVVKNIKLAIDNY